MVNKIVWAESYPVPVSKCGRLGWSMLTLETASRLAYIFEAREQLSCGPPFIFKTVILDENRQ
jgi:hypothetical protein